ncbi:MAG: BamA/OMP85 family outer membrane protein [Verrucomicrobiales bacterium]
MPRNYRCFLPIAVLVIAALSSPASIQITGLREVPQEKALAIIADQVAQEKAKGGSRPLADDASFFLERELRRGGYDKADVEWRFDEASKQITLVVDEGTNQTLGEITISGNVAEVADDDIRALVRRSTNNRKDSTLAGGTEGLPYVSSDIASGLADVAQLYRSLGYWDVKVAPLESSRTVVGDRNDVHVQITAGTMHHFRGFQLTGDTGDRSAELQAELSRLVGQPFTTDNVNSARAEVSDFYDELGYFRHEITSAPKEHGDEITLVFAISAGEAFDVASFKVEGNEKVKESFLLKRFEPLVGQPYSPTETDKIYRELLSIGLFTRISLAPEEIPGSENLVDVTINVEEARARSAGAYIGYGTYDGAILGLIYRNNNIFGSGRQFKGALEYTQRGLGGDIEYSDKWFLDSPFFFNAKLFGASKDEEGYSKFEYGARVELGRDIGKHYSISAFATLAHTEITDAEIEAVNLGLTNYRVGSIGLAHSWNQLDNVALPSRGFIFDNSFEYASSALSSDVEFFRGVVRLSAYFPITKKTQLSLGARSGFIQPTGDTKQIPIDLRFFSGGSTSVRSFREKFLGPYDRKGYPLGGQFYTTFNAEYTIPIAGGLKAAIFADAGNLLRDLDNASFDRMHYAAGAGLRYDLPTGPIRLDYGHNLNRGPREPSGSVHVSIGIAF